jgi:hypothetical protein
MAPIRNTYTIPFDPSGNAEGEFATTKESFNHQGFQHKRGSRVSPYPSFVDIYKRSEWCVANGDMFEDLMLADMVEANKRWRKCWRDCLLIQLTFFFKGFLLLDP